MADSIRCLICKDSVSGLREHIRKHLLYKPERCGNCDFSTWSDTLLTIHEAQKGHSGRVKDTDPYREQLVSQIHDDCVYASLDGLAAAINRVSQRSGLSISDCGASRSATRKTPAQTRNTRQTPVQSAPKRKKPSPVEESDDEEEENEEEEEERPARANLGRNKRNRSNSPSYSIQILTENMLRSPVTTVGCRTCGKRISESFVARQEHCSKLHMPPDHSDEDYTDLLEASMRAAFPCMAYNEKQCVLCLKEYVRLEGRENHVLNKHWSETLGCPVRNCQFASVDVRKITVHMKETHKKYPNGFADLPRLIYNQFMEQRNKYKTRQSQTINECFPAPLPLHGREREVAGRNRAALAAATANLASIDKATRVPMRRPMSSSSEEGEDEERRQKKTPARPAPSKTISLPLSVDEETDENESDVEVVEKRKNTETAMPPMPAPTSTPASTSAPKSAPASTSASNSDPAPATAHTSAISASPVTTLHSSYRPPDHFAGRVLPLGRGPRSFPPPPTNSLRRTFPSVADRVIPRGGGRVMGGRPN